MGVGRIAFVHQAAGRVEERAKGQSQGPMASVDRAEGQMTGLGRIAFVHLAAGRVEERAKGQSQGPMASVDRAVGQMTGLGRMCVAVLVEARAEDLMMGQIWAASAEEKESWLQGAGQVTEAAFYTRQCLSRPGAKDLSAPLGC